MKRFDVRKKSVIFTLVLPYVTMLILFVSTIALLIFEASDVVQNDTLKYKADVLENMKSSIDGRMEDLKMLSTQLAMDENVRSLCSYTGEINQKQRENIRNIIKRLSLITSTNAFVENVYVYSAKQEIAVTNETYFKKDSYISILENKYGIDESKFDKIHNEINTELFFGTIKKRLISGKYTEVLCFTQNVPFGEKNFSYGKIVIMVNEEKISELLTASKRNFGNEMFILDSENKMIAATEETESKLSLDYRSLNELSGRSLMKIDDKEYIMTYLTSNREKFKYVAILPVVKAYESAERIFVFAIFYSLLALAMSIAVISYFLKRHNAEIKNIIKKISQKIGHHEYSADGENEYKFIDEVLNKVEFLKPDEKKVLDRQKDYMRQNFIDNLMEATTYIKDTAYLEKLAEEYEILTDSEFFCVFVLNVIDYEPFFADCEDLTEQKKWEVVLFAIKNVVEELCEQKHKGYVIDKSGIISCVVNFNNAENRDSFKEDVESIARKAVSFLRDNLEIEVICGIGDIQFGFLGISNSFSHAIEASEFIQTGERENNDVLCYSDISYDDGNFSYSFDMEQQLINSIKLCETTNAIHIVNGFIENEIEKKRVPSALARFILYGIVSTILRGIDYSATVEELDDLNNINKLISKPDILKNLEPIKEQMEKLVVYACGFYNAKSRGDTRTIIESVQKFVEENYSNINLSVNMIGERFYFTPAYISKIYKESTKESLLTLINRTRIKKAKELILNTNMKIEEISSRVGYSGSTVFIRIFKKHEGITPGMFKEMIRDRGEKLH